MLDTLKDYIKAFFNSRLLPVTVVFVLLFSILINRMFELQIVDRDSIIASGASNTIKEKDIKATRGNIYDCNGTLLAYNKLSYNIVFSETSKLTGMTDEEKNTMIYRLLYILKKHGSELSVDIIWRMITASCSIRWRAALWSVIWRMHTLCRTA